MSHSIHATYANRSDLNALVTAGDTDPNPADPTDDLHEESEPETNVAPRRLTLVAAGDTDPNPADPTDDLHEESEPETNVAAA